MKSEKERENVERENLQSRENVWKAGEESVIENERENERESERESERHDHVL
jgi:hypothetical protein